MKAKNKKTGEAVTSFGISKEWGTVSYIDSTNTLRFSTPLDGEWEIIDESEPVDWSTFRREAVKDILGAVIAKKSSMCPYGEVVEEAIKFADELIKQLKEK